ncbi:hypothetical protein KJ359_006191 [Pestalotiopsis sp. 9143b]|nr:hypothetical protein KJ359_006191 [Pestalotiopsis sp. 9143b]
MPPATRSHDRFPAICTAQISTQVLQSFLKQMPQTVALVAQGDFSVLLTDNADGSSRLGSIQVLSEYVLYNYDAVTRLVHTATQATGIKKTAFILLDRATADDGVSCCIAIDAREDDESAPLLGFRCEFGSIEPALKAIEQGVPVKELRDQSFMAGGLWRKDVVEDRLTRSSSLNMSDFFPAHKDWKPAFTDDVSLHFPVFRTAEVSIKTLNNFLEQAYDHEWGPLADPRVAFITKLNAPFTDGLAEAPLKSAPEPLEMLYGAKPSECDAVVRNRFWDDSLDPKLDRHRFIIMDEFTETDRSVITAVNFQDQGRLIISRADFKLAVLNLMAPGTTGLCAEDIADSATTSGLGIGRWKTPGRHG